MIKYFTDNYDKGSESNLSKLTRVLQNPLDALPFDKIRLWRGVNSAQGTTLDLIGSNVDQPRGAVNDTVYRSLIRSKVLRNNSNGTVNELIDLMAFVLQVDKSQINIVEGHELVPEISAFVRLENIPATALEPIGLTTSQVQHILNEAAMAGVRVEVEFIFNTWGAIDQYTWSFISTLTWQEVKENELGGVPLP